MDSKNVIAAITMSTAVIVLYSLFFVPEKTTTNKNVTEKNKIEQNAKKLCKSAEAFNQIK